MGSNCQFTKPKEKLKGAQCSEHNYEIQCAQHWFSINEKAEDFLVTQEKKSVPGASEAASLQPYIWTLHIYRNLPVANSLDQKLVKSIHYHW